MTAPLAGGHRSRSAHCRWAFSRSSATSSAMFSDRSVDVRTGTPEPDRSSAPAESEHAAASPAGSALCISKPTHSALPQTTCQRKTSIHGPVRGSGHILLVDGRWSPSWNASGTALSLHHFKQWSPPAATGTYAPRRRPAAPAALPCLVVVGHDVVYTYQPRGPGNARRATAGVALLVKRFARNPALPVWRTIRWPWPWPRPRSGS